MQKNFLEIISSYSISSKYAFYYKVTLFLINKNISVDKIKWKKLEEISWDLIEEIESKEQEYIDKFDSEANGFNGPISL